MKNKIKLIWKFSGPDADHIAKHHLVHLKEYIEKENIYPKKEIMQEKKITYYKV